MKRPSWPSPRADLRHYHLTEVIAYMEKYFDLYKRLVFYAALALLFVQYVCPEGLREKLIHGEEMPPKWFGPFSFGAFVAYLIRIATMPLALGMWPNENAIAFFGDHTYLVALMMFAWFFATWWIARKLDGMR